MKLQNLLMAFFAGGLALAGCNQTPKVPEGEFLIEGELKNVPDSVVIELFKSDGNTMIRIASDTLLDGKFSLKDTISTKTPVKYALMPDESGFPGTWSSIWMASGTYVKITGEDKLHPLWNVESDVSEQKTVSDFMALCPQERKRHLQLLAQEYDLFRTSKNIFEDWPKVDSLRSLYGPLDSLVTLAELNYMKEAPVTRVWLDKYKLYSSYLQWNSKFGHQDLIRSLYDRMSEKDKATEAGKEITAYMNLPEMVNVGDEMADGDLYDLDGNVRHLSEFKGKYILLDFWSQGCGPCRSSIPELEEIMKLYEGKMEVVSINEDTKDQWQNVVKDRQLKGNQWNELRKGRTGLAAAYQVNGIPHYVMISPEGKVKDMWAGYGPGSLKAKMKELIK